jgi:hypothetical protein
VNESPSGQHDPSEAATPFDAQTPQCRAEREPLAAPVYGGHAAGLRVRKLDQAGQPPPVDPDAIVDRLRHNLTLTAELVAYGHALQAAAPGVMRLPGSLIQFGGRDSSQIAPYFGPWMLTVGLRRYIEIFGEFLIEVGALSTLYRAQLTMPWSFDGPNTAAKFRGWSLPRRLDAIQDNLGESIPSAVRTDIESINKVRAAYEQDAGVVTAKRATEGELVLSFRGVDFHYRNSEEIVRIHSLPTPIPADAVMEVSPVSRIRCFAVGERIELSPNDFAEIGFSLQQAAAEIIYTFPPYHAQRDARPDPALPQHFQHTIPPGSWQFPLPVRLY